jgi:hypothetical protein
VVVVVRERRARRYAQAALDRALLDGSLGGECVGLLLSLDYVFLVSDPLVAEPVGNLKHLFTSSGYHVIFIEDHNHKIKWSLQNSTLVLIYGRLLALTKLLHQNATSKRF